MPVRGVADLFLVYPGAGRMCQRRGNVHRGGASLPHERPRHLDGADVGPVRRIRAWSNRMETVVDMADGSTPTPTPLVPAGPVGTRSPGYSWTPVTGAVWYQLSIKDALNITKEFWYSRQEACSDLELRRCAEPAARDRPRTVAGARVAIVGGRRLVHARFRSRPPMRRLERPR